MMLLRKRTVRIDDFCFERKWFHSATLRVTEPPGGGPLECYLVIILFITGGMKEFGVRNATVQKTVMQYQSLLRQLGLPQLSEEEITRLGEEKTQELKLRLDARAKKAEAAKRAAPVLSPDENKESATAPS